MIGAHTVTITPPGGALADISCLVDSLSIAHGRASAESQPDAATVTIDLSLKTGPDSLPIGLDIGTAVVVVTTVAGVGHRRFTGAVTDVVLGWDDAGADTPNAVVAQVIAAGPLASLGRRIVGDVPWPQELDGARVARIMSLAGMPLDPATSDPGTVQILARDVDSQPALTLAQEVAQTASGWVWETRAGEVRYADAEHRRNVTSALTLGACDVLVTPTWRRDTEGLVNDVSIGYGATPDGGGEQPRFTATRPESQALFGRYEISVSTTLAAQADAAAMGNLLLTRNAAPVWLLSELPVAVADLDAAETAALLDVDMHDLISVTGLPAVGALLPTSTALWVEGWTETLADDTHDLSLYVSGYCRTSPPPRWDDLDPAWTWDTLPPLTWDDLACLGPMPSRGRWSDVPASLRWDGVNPAITWDTWDS